MPLDPLKYLVRLVVKYAGTIVSSNAKSINFTGAGQTTSSSNDDVTINILGGGSGDLLSTNNLSDLANVTSARTNLGLGTAATKNVGTAAGDVAAGNKGVTNGDSHDHNGGDGATLGTSALVANAVTQNAYVEGSTGSPTTTSGTDATIAEMTLSVTSTGGIWIIDFSGIFRHSDTTNNSTVMIRIDGAEKGQSYRDFVAMASGKNISIHTMWMGAIPAGSATITVSWSTGGGTLTAYSTKRQLRAFELKR
jgi:hypothetical protein